jgi:hypothetical protein
MIEQMAHEGGAEVAVVAPVRASPACAASFGDAEALVRPFCASSISTPDPEMTR